MWQLAIIREAERLALQKAITAQRHRYRSVSQRAQTIRKQFERALAAQQTRHDHAIELYKHRIHLLNEKLAELESKLNRIRLIERRRCNRRLDAYKALAARSQEQAVSRIRAEANKTIAEQKALFTRQIRTLRRKTALIWKRRIDQIKTVQSAIPHRPKPRHHRKARGTTAHTASRVATITVARQRHLRQQAPSEAPVTSNQIAIETEREFDKALLAIRRTAHCECCFRNGVIEDDLTQIDSGQRLCPDCMAALKEKITQIRLFGQ